tara:strand:+ start:1713 stop:2033 length:321 start_codon:yes stop_codon:yes gene_type:complete
MKIRNKKELKELVKNLFEEIKKDEEEIEEVNVTSDIEGYNTPFAFSGKSGVDKKKRRRYSTNSTGYKMVNEELDSKDLSLIKTLIRDVISDVLRDIWLKRNAWKGK